MAFNFPNSPFNGQLYPDPEVPGVTQYVWSSAKGTWLTVFKGVQSVKTVEPAFETGTNSTPIIGIQPATPDQDGYMTSADKRKLDAIPDPDIIPSTSKYVTLMDISPLFTGSRVAFPLRSNGNEVFPTSPMSMMIVLGDEVLTPFSGYSVIGSDIVFQSAPMPGTQFNGVALI